MKLCKPMVKQQSHVILSQTLENVCAACVELCFFGKNEEDSFRFFIHLRQRINVENHDDVTADCSSENIASCESDSETSQNRTDTSTAQFSKIAPTKQIFQNEWLAGNQSGYKLGGWFAKGLAYSQANEIAMQNNLTGSNSGILMAMSVITVSAAHGLDLRASVTETSIWVRATH